MGPRVLIGALLATLFLGLPIAAAAAASPSEASSASASTSPSSGSPTPGNNSSRRTSGKGILIGVLIVGGAVYLIRRSTGVRPNRFRRPPPDVDE